MGTRAAFTLTIADRRDVAIGAGSRPADARRACRSTPDKRETSFVTFYRAAAAFFGFHPQPGGATNLSEDRLSATSIGPGASESYGSSATTSTSRWKETGSQGSSSSSLVIAQDIPSHSAQSRRPKRLVSTFEMASLREPGCCSRPETGGSTVGSSLTHSVAAQKWGVEVVIDPLTRLEAFLAARERHGVKFQLKVKVPKSDDENFGTFKTVAAFANEGDGGSVLVGVSDDRELVGIEAAKADREIDSLTQMLRAWVTPPPRTRSSAWWTGKETRSSSS